MGRPKGSKNKVTKISPTQMVEKIQNVRVEEKPVVQKKQQTLKLVVPETPAVEDKVPVTTDFIRAVTDLAVIAGRNYYLDKLQQWAEGLAAGHENLTLTMEYDEKMEADVFTVFADGERLDVRHVFRRDVEDVVRGVLGAR